MVPINGETNRVFPGFKVMGSRYVLGVGSAADLGFEGNILMCARVIGLGSAVNPEPTSSNSKPIVN